MMVMPGSEEQLSFFRKPRDQRDSIVEKLTPIMVRTWPGFEKKHAEMGHTLHRRHEH